jgi:predicted small lipoprotein YifL
MKKLILILLALSLLLTLAACGSSKGISHKDYVAAALDTQVTVETYVQAHQSWWDGKVTVYAQSKDGAYFLYNMACSEADAAKLTEGTKIIVTGYKSEWSGEVEIVDATFEFGKGTYVAKPTDVTGLLGSDKLIDHQNEKVVIKGLTVASTFLYKWDGSGQEGDDLYFDVSDGKNTYTFTVESYLCGADTDVYKAVKNLKVGDKIDVEGFLYWYEGVQPHVTSVTPA